PRRGRLRLRNADARDGDPDDHDVDHLDDLDPHHDHDGEPLMAKRLDPKAKAKREKVIAGVGGLVLLGVLAFAIPMTMKQLKSQQAPAAAAAATPSTSTTTPTVTASLASSGGTSTVALGQLGSLSRFDSKDPFAQQVDPHGVIVLVGKLPGQTGRSPGSGAAPPASSPPPPPPPKVA